jgi:hypothetical protein
METGMSDRSERLHGLDAVRGYALLLGVIFHATGSFLLGPQIWPAHDNHPSAVLSGLFFVSHIFRMTTFFLIAGFFAHMTFHKRGLKAFVADRVKRIAVPLVVFWPVLFLGILLSAGYAVYVATGVFPTKPPPAPPQPWGAFHFTHLWFLYVLLWLYAATLALRGLAARLDGSGALRARLDGAVEALLEHPAAPLALTLPVAVAFYATPGWLTWFGVPTPDANVIPNLPAAVQFFLAFGLGWLIHRQPGLIERATRRWGVNVALAVALTAGLLANLGVQPVVHPDPPGLVRALHALAYGLAVWTWTFAVIGLSLRFLADHSPVRRYIADSSYWIYLVHMPIVMFLQAWVSRFDWPWEAKFAAILGIGFALMFATYEVLVRHSFIGAMLNGRRVPWRAAQASITRAPISPVEAAR